MKLGFIRRLYAYPGPFASVYMNTDRSTETAVAMIQRRWAGLRERLAAAGAPDAVLDPIADVVLDPALAAPGRAVFAQGTEVVLTEALAAPPRRETARWAPLPHVVPLLAQRGEHVPHVLVLADRAGGDVIIITEGQRRELSVEAAEWPIQKTGEGGWAQYRFERDVEETWRRNAAAVAQVVNKEVHAAGAEVIVLAGDPKARALVTEYLDKDAIRKLTIAEHGSRAPGAAWEPFQAEVDRACTAWADRCRAELLAAFAAGPAVAGLQETTRALRDRRVHAVLLRDDPTSTATAWIGPEPSQVSTDRAELVTWGVDAPVQDRADAALARAVAAIDAELWFVQEIASPDGVGAVLRF